ncbi:MAG: hypothetical protein QXF56_00920 [Candidatus Micrarchaeia archaeon]
MGAELTELIQYQLDLPREQKSVSDEKRIFELKALLSEEKPVFQSIGMGLNNGIFYIGTKVYKDGKYYDAVITSQKEIFIDWGKGNNEIKQKFQLNYRFPFYHEVVEHCWGNTGEYGIYTWLFGNPKLLSLKEVYADVLELVKWKYWHPDERVYKHHTLSIISNYFLPIFEMKGRELIYGQSGWGKTRLSKIYLLLSFNPVMSADFSDSSIFRIIESVKPTIIIDNFDSQEEERRKRILHIFNTGCYSRQKTIRAEGKTYKPTGFGIFSPMVLNSITALDEIAENRSNITRTLKTEKSEYIRLDEDNPLWAKVRNKLHVCALQNYRDVKKVYEELNESRLFARELERIIPNLVIAKLISTELYEEMLRFYVEDTERRKMQDFSDDWVYLAMQIIVEKLSAVKENEIELSVGEIVEELAPKIFDSESGAYDRKKHGLSVVLGSTFKNCLLFPARKLHGYPVYKFSKEAVIQFCRLKDYDEEITEKIRQMLLDNSPNSTNSPNSPNSTNSPNSPNSTNSPNSPNSTNSPLDAKLLGELGELGESKAKKVLINQQTAEFSLSDVNSPQVRKVKEIKLSDGDSHA